MFFKKGIAICFLLTGISISNEVFADSSNLLPTTNNAADIGYLDSIVNANIEKDVVEPEQVAVHKFTNQEVVYASIILAFGLIVLALAAWLISKTKSPDPILILRFFVIILIVICAVLLVFVGYNKDQITQIVGLFGTITGYLLGRIDSQPKSNDT
jgi:uncharacterized protein YacL